MSKFYKILWSLAILFMIVTTIIFTFGLILVGGAMVGLFGIYRYYLKKKSSKNFKAWPKGFSTDEIIDIPSEPVHPKIMDINYEKYRKRP